MKEWFMGPSYFLPSGALVNLRISVKPIIYFGVKPIT